MSTIELHNEATRTAVIEWITYILGRKKWTPTDLARNCGLSPSTVLRIVNRDEHKFVPTFKTLQKISNGSGYPIPKEVIESMGAMRFDEPLESLPVSRKGASTASARTMIEVKHVSALPSSLHPQARKEVSVPAPPQMEGDETAFAFYMPDATFDPILKAGSLMYATRRRDPIPGDLLLVTDKDGRSKVRVMIDMDEKGLKLSQSLPVQVDDGISFDEIEEMAIVGVMTKI